MKQLSKEDIDIAVNRLGSLCTQGRVEVKQLLYTMYEIKEEKPTLPKAGWWRTDYGAKELRFMVYHSDSLYPWATYDLAGRCQLQQQTQADMVRAIKANGYTWCDPQPKIG